MSKPDPKHDELVAWLKEAGHSDVEVEKILAKLSEYDAQTMHESVFDSINSGHFDIASIIAEALGEDKE